MPVAYLSPNAVGPSGRPFWVNGPGGYSDPNYGISSHPQSTAPNSLAGVQAAGDGITYTSDWDTGTFGNPGIDDVWSFPAWAAYSSVPSDPVLTGIPGQKVAWSWSEAVPVSGSDVVVVTLNPVVTTGSATTVGSIQITPIR